MIAPTQAIAEDLRRAEEAISLGAHHFGRVIRHLRERGAKDAELAPMLMLHASLLALSEKMGKAAGGSSRPASRAADDREQQAPCACAGCNPKAVLH